MWLRSLRLYDSVPIWMLKSIVRSLESYEREASPLTVLENFLAEVIRRKNQEPVREKYISFAGLIAMKLFGYDVRLEELKKVMEKEARTIHGDSRASKGWRVLDEMSREYCDESDTFLSPGPGIGRSLRRHDRVFE